MYGVLQDRQLINTLSYLYTNLRSDSVLLQQLDAANNIVKTTMLRTPIVEDKGKKTGRLINVKGLPYLSLYREGGERYKQGSEYYTKAHVILSHLMTIPRGNNDYDGETWSLSWLNNIFHRICYYMETAPNDFYSDSGILSIQLSDYELGIIEESSIGFLWSGLEIHHIHYPYDEEELIDLERITGEIKLYGVDEEETDLSVDLELDL